MSASFASISALAGNAWAAFSFWSLLGAGSGIGLIVLAFVASAWLPGFIRKPLIVAGAAILALAVVYQAGSTRGAQAAFQLDMERRLQAEATRATQAERIRDRIATQATTDIAAEQARNETLKEINRALSRDKDRNRECIDGGTARRLRGL